MPGADRRPLRVLQCLLPKEWGSGIGRELPQARTIAAQDEAASSSSGGTKPEVIKPWRGRNYVGDIANTI